MAALKTPPSVPGTKKVPLRTKVTWGFGGLADNFMFNTLTALGTLVYVNHFGLTPALAGLALAFPRLVDAFTDPWIGNLSDNAKTRLGRRRPFMLFGVIACAVLLPLLWTVPGVETAGNPWYSNLPFLYVCFIGSMLAIAYTLFVVPYTALGFELTPDYDERTRTLVWRMYIGLAGSLGAGWLFRIASEERFFPDLGVGAFWVTVGVSIIVLIAGMIPVIGCREDLEIERQEPIRLFPAIRYSMTNKPFVILFIAYVFIIVAMFAAQGIAPLLLQHHVFDGSAIKVGTFTGAVGTMAVALSYVSMILITFVSIRTNKRVAMILGLALVLTGTVLNYWAIDPRWPWALYVASFVTFLGMQGCWLMVASMVADVCDDDELTSGRRREGMFSAAIGFGLKAAQGITFGIGGYMATKAGFDPAVVAESGLAPDVAVRMKALLIGFQAAGLVLAIYLMTRYPITRERAEANQRDLKARARRPAPGP